MLRIVEKFKSIQSEGYHAGTPATFIRLFGCNLSCDFGNGMKCDEPLHTDKSVSVLMSVDDIVDYCKGLNHVVITGGEPSLYNLLPLINKLKLAGHYVQVETNGHNIGNIYGANWITYSPKVYWSNKAKYLYENFDELKLCASPHNVPDESLWGCILCAHKYIQPINGTEEILIDNVVWAVDWISNHPGWKLSIQYHKMLGLQ